MDSGRKGDAFAPFAHTLQEAFCGASGASCEHCKAFGRQDLVASLDDNRVDRDRCRESVACLDACRDASLDDVQAADGAQDVEVVEDALVDALTLVVVAEGSFSVAKNCVYSKRNCSSRNLHRSYSESCRDFQESYSVVLD